MRLDVATLLLVYSVLVLVAALGAVVTLGRQGSRAGVSAQLSTLAQAFGWWSLMGAGAAAGSAAERWLAGAAVLLMSLGLVALTQAVHMWRGHRRWPRRACLAAGTMAVVYTLGYDDHAFRVGWSNAALALQMGWVVVEALRSGQPGGWRWRSLLVAAMLPVSAVTLTRAAMAVMQPELLGLSIRAEPLINQLIVLSSCTASMLALAAMLAAFREEAEGQLKTLAITDGLTQVLNRRAWSERADVLLADARRYDHPLIVLMIDLDRFKLINDQRGHAVGDAALQLAAQVLREELRVGDLVGRYGGEEFCVLLSHTREAAALTFDQRLRRRLRQRSEQELGFVLEYSAGLTAWRTKDRSLDDLLRRADAALYEAKRAGRGQLVMSP